MQGLAVTREENNSLFVGAFLGNGVRKGKRRKAQRKKPRRMQKKATKFRVREVEEFPGWEIWKPADGRAKAP